MLLGFLVLKLGNVVDNIFFFFVLLIDGSRVVSRLFARRKKYGDL